MEFFQSQDGLLVLGILALVFIGASGWYIWKQLEKSQHQRQIHKVLESLGVKYLHNIILPDGIEGYTYIDYLLLAPNGVIVLDINFSEGHLFGGESIDQWTQIVKNKTFKFNNPLYDNQTKCQALLWNVENNIDDAKGLNVHGWVAFSSAGNFPKGIPNQVSMISNLKADLEKNLNLSPNTNESFQNAWDQLHDLSIATQKKVGG